MEQQQHTPAPWKADLHHLQQNGARTYAFVFADGLVPICGVHVCVEGMPDEEGRANARLIAAAPDLLAALLHVRALIVEGAMTGFNCHDGDWAERLFASQGMSHDAVKKAIGTGATTDQSSVARRAVATQGE